MIVSEIPRRLANTRMCSVTSCSVSRSPVRMMTSSPAASPLRARVPMTSSASKVGTSMMGMPSTSTTSRAHGICARSSSGARERCALYSATRSCRNVGPGRSKAATANVGVVSLSALNNIDVKPYAALVISPRLLLNAGIAKKARYTRLWPSTSSRVSRGTADHGSRAAGTGSMARDRGYDRAMADLVEMTVDSIRVHMPTGQHVVILKEKTADRYLPIWIGINEANAIALKITGITPERPITHDLLANLLSAVEVTVDRIVVTSLSNEVFYARILAQVDGRRLEIDSRPSDAIAVAVRVGAGIFVADEVLDKAGVLPESDKDGELTETDPESEERLPKISDWVKTLKLPDLGTGASES